MPSKSGVRKKSDHWSDGLEVAGTRDSTCFHGGSGFRALGLGVPGRLSTNCSRGAVKRRSKISINKELKVCSEWWCEGRGDGGRGGERGRGKGEGRGRGEGARGW